MEPLQNTISSTAQTTDLATPSLCKTCHIPLLPQYYFCPNCGKEVVQPPLPTDTLSQLKLYSLSLILPLICFITIGKWKAIHYLRDENEKAKNIGRIACLLLLFSTLLTVWVTITSVQKFLKITQDATSIDLNNY
jgi:hypothetical protein